MPKIAPPQMGIPGSTPVFKFQKHQVCFALRDYQYALVAERLTNGSSDRVFTTLDSRYQRQPPDHIQGFNWVGGADTFAAERVPPAAPRLQHHADRSGQKVNPEIHQHCKVRELRFS